MGVGKLSPKFGHVQPTFAEPLKQLRVNNAMRNPMAFPELDVRRDRVTQHVMWRAPTVELHDL